MSKILGTMSEEEFKMLLASYYADKRGYVGLSEDNIQFTISLEDEGISFIVSVTDV